MKTFREIMGSLQIFEEPYMEEGMNPIVYGPKKMRKKVILFCLLCDSQKCPEKKWAFRVGAGLRSPGS